MFLPCAQIAALMLLALAFWGMEELRFLLPYKRLLIHSYGLPVVLFVFVLYANLVALLYVIMRQVTLGHMGRHLQHVERQLRTSQQSVHPTLTERLRK
jgi:hypothetical protein